MISRRKFIKIGALASIGGYSLGVSGKLFGKTPGAAGLNLLSAESLSNPISSFTSEHFAPLVNTNFKIRHENMDGVKNLRLLEVKDLNNPANNLPGMKGDCFSLFFQSEKTEQIEGTIYDVSHKKLGNFSLFISPVTSEPNLYEAIIFRLNV